jgi:hypothetical protein
VKRVESAFRALRSLVRLHPHSIPGGTPCLSELATEAAALWLLGTVSDSRSMQ